MPNSQYELELLQSWERSKSYLKVWLSSSKWHVLQKYLWLSINFFLNIIWDQQLKPTFQVRELARVGHTKVVWRPQILTFLELILPITPWCQQSYCGSLFLLLLLLLLICHAQLSATDNFKQRLFLLLLL